MKIKREGFKPMSKQPISVIGMPMDLGQGRRGVDMGPSAIRYAKLQTTLKLLGFDIEDLGDIQVPSPESIDIGDDHLKFLSAVCDVNESLAEAVSKVIKRKRFPLVLGGDHSMAIGTIAGVAKHYNNLGLIWYDAHGDLNTGGTSPSGNIHGMSLAASLGFGHPALVNVGGYAPKVKSENVVLVGVRELDKGEQEIAREMGLKVFTMHEVDRLGFARVIEEALSVV
jgi:arginase